MKRQALPFVLVLAGLALGGCGTGNLVSKLPGLGSTQRYLPDTGAVRGLRRESGYTTYRGKDMAEYLGPPAGLYIEYGAHRMAYADYTLGSPEQTLTIEVFDMDGGEAAAGIYHYFRGRKLQGKGQPVEVGAEGVLDRVHENRNLYFYKQSMFFKLIYTGRKPVPNMVPLARALAMKVSGESAPPRGFQYLEMSGIDRKSARVSPGYTFNYDFLPAGIIASAPGVGPIAEVFLIGHHDKKEAHDTARDYRTYLELNGIDYNMKYDENRRRIAFGRDPNQGRVIFTQYESYVIGVVRPKTYAKGEALINRIIQRMRRYGE